MIRKWIEKARLKLHEILDNILWCVFRPFVFVGLTNLSHYDVRIGKSGWKACEDAYIPFVVSHEAEVFGYFPQDVPGLWRKRYLL